MAAVGILLLTAATFAVTIRNGFLKYDDPDYIIDNQAIAQGLTPRAVYWSFKPTGYASNWHPLTWMSHALDNFLADGAGLDWRMRGKGSGRVVDVECAPYARFIHAENVLLHAANALLLWGLMMVMFFRLDDGRTDRARAVILTTCVFALFWSLHPLRVEVVAWASERKELLSVFFMLLALVTYVWNEKHGSEFVNAEIPDDPDRAFVVKSLKFVSRHASVIVLALFCCAVLSKPVAVSLPAVLFAYDWMLGGRTFRDSLSRVVPFAAISVFVCYMTMISQTVALAAGAKVDALTHLICVVEAPVIYLRQTVWPFGLSVDYPFPDGTEWLTMGLGGLLLIGLVAIAVAAVRSRVGRIDAADANGASPSFLDFLAFSAVWTYVGLLPMIGIVRVGFEPHSDRYTYWIGCGAAVFAADAVIRLLPKIGRCGRAWFFGATALLIAFAVLSVRQCFVWYDTETLFADAVEKYHGEMFAQGLGEVLEERGGEDIAHAEDLLRRIMAIRKTPASRAALALHLSAFRADDPEALKEARELAESAIREDADSKWAYAALGFADHHEGAAKSAFSNMKKAKDLGYVSRVVKVDLDEWELDASREVPRTDKRDNAEK